jgi:WG containing repeat
MSRAKRMKYLLTLLTILILAGPAFSANSYECSYYQKDSQEMAVEKSCLTYSENTGNKTGGGDAAVSGKVAARASYDENGLGFLYSPAGVFYFTRSGFARKTLSFDNGPDYFREGLARTEQNGKIGFFDRTLSVVIEPRYDFAFPFHHGLAVVCNGCTQKKSGEHTVVVGGAWGAINTKGAIVKPVAFSRAELEGLLR